MCLIPSDSIKTVLGCSWLITTVKVSMNSSVLEASTLWKKYGIHFNIGLTYALWHLCVCSVSAYSALGEAQHCFSSPETIIYFT